MPTLLTLNVKGGRAPLLRPLTAFLCSLELDVLCLQECDWAAVRWLQDQLAGDWQASWAPAAYCGNAVLSRHPLRSARLLSLQVPHHETRSAVDAVIELPSGPLRVCCTHLDHVAEPTRLAQWAVLSAAAAAVGGGLLCGDLNALCRSDYTDAAWENIAAVRSAGGWESPQHALLDALLAEGFTDAVGEPPEPTSRFETRIDYVLAAADCPWRPVERTTLPVLALGLSDHNGVQVRLVR